MDIPEEFLNLPNDPNFLYGAGTATSRDLQIALDNAKLSGRGEIVTTLEAKYQGLTKRFAEETGTGMD